MRRSLFMVLGFVAACSGATPSADSTIPEPVAPSTTVQQALDPTPIERSQAAPTGTTSVSELASRTRPLGSAILEPPAAPAPQPIGLTISSLEISAASVVDVGVEPNGEMEIPGATEIGWYRFGASPGEDGSAVLAAHIAFNGRDGVFRNLDDIEVGAIVEVLYDDGSTQRFEITETAQYAKDELPLDRVFAKEGAPVLTLITCGGDFNRSLNSYADNVVAYAEPIDS